jgi:hypothetical protein
MTIIILIGCLALTGWAAVNRTPIEVRALLDDGSEIVVYKTSVWTRALYYGHDKTVYAHLAKMIRRNVRIDTWLRGVDFGVTVDGDEYIFVIRYEDVMTYNTLEVL